MVISTRTKFTDQLNEVEVLIRRFGEKTVADVRAAGLAVTGDHGAAEGVMEGRKAEDRLRSAIENTCLDIMLLQQPLIGVDLRFVSGSFRMVSDLSHIDSMTRDAVFLAEEIPAKAAKKLEKGQHGGQGRRRVLHLRRGEGPAGNGGRHRGERPLCRGGGEAR